MEKVKDELAKTLKFTDGIKISHDEATDNILIMNDDLGFCITLEQIQTLPRENVIDLAESALNGLKEALGRLNTIKRDAKAFGYEVVKQ